VLRELRPKPAETLLRPRETIVDKELKPILLSTDEIPGPITVDKELTPSPADKVLKPYCTSISKELRPVIPGGLL
jgi:hypothetical protein